MKKHTSKVTIEIYDEDGVLAESIGGVFSHDEIKDQMIDILKNDGIPVIRRLGKHEAAEPACDRRGGNLPPESKAAPAFEQPMTLRIEFDDIKFMVVGKYDDVMDAQAEFLRTILAD